MLRPPLRCPFPPDIASVLPPLSSPLCFLGASPLPPAPPLSVSYPAHPPLVSDTMPDKRSAAGGGGGGGKRKKAKYINGGGGGGGSGAARRSTLPTGRRGFLVTCEPRHDVRAGREAVALLGEFIDRALAAQGGESGEARGAGGGGGGFSSGGGSGGGVAAALEGELAELRTGGVGGEREINSGNLA